MARKPRSGKQPDDRITDAHTSRLRRRGRSSETTPSELEPGLPPEYAEPETATLEAGGPKKRKHVAVPDDAPPVPQVFETEAAEQEKPQRRRRTRDLEGGAVRPEEAKRRPTSKRSADAETTVERITPRITLEQLQALLDQGAKQSKPRRPKERWPRPIPPPPGAPRIAIVNGQPALVIEERVVAPHFFFGNIHDEASEKNVLSEIKKAAQRGLHLHCLYLELPVEPSPSRVSADEALRLLELVLEKDPEAWVMFRVVFTPTSGWMERYPDAVYRYPDGTLAEPSVCSVSWWGDAERCLRKLVTELAKKKIGKKVIGIHLERGEWFNGKDCGYDTSEAALQAFREWLRARYFGDTVALRASWHDGSADFDTLNIPEFVKPKEMPAALLTERKERRWVDYHDFLSDAHVERIGALGRAVKEASKGALLVACSYGYTFEFSHPYSGHLSLARLLRCPDVDIIAGPPSYESRKPGSACPFPGPIDAIALSGKLFVLEEDYKTGLAQKGEQDDYNPLLSGPKELEAAHGRGLGIALAHSCGVAWMDTWGHGWLDMPSIWNRAESASALFAARLSLALPPPDVAVLIDERSMTMLQDSRLATNLISKAREAVLRAGVCAGFYLLSDLTRRDFPDCKLYLFLNAWDIGAQVRAAIREKLHKSGKTLAWWYAAALLEYHKPAPETMKQITGIAIKAQPFASKPGTTITQHKHPITAGLEESVISTQEVYEPTYFAADEDAETLGVYTDTGLPSIVVREIMAPGKQQALWRSVFIGEPFISWSLVRGLCRYAGVPLYTLGGDVAHIRPPFLTLHASRAGRRQVNLAPGQELRDAMTGERCPPSSSFEGTSMVDVREGETRILVMGTPRELEQLALSDFPPAPPLAEGANAASWAVPQNEVGELAKVGSKGERSRTTRKSQSRAAERSTPTRAKSPKRTDEGARTMKPGETPVSTTSPENEGDYPVGFRFRKKSTQ